MNKPKGAKRQKESIKVVIKKAAKAAKSLDTSLTARELEVLKLMATGKTSAEIANVLFISLPTVESHRSKILRKFGVGNMIEAVAKALRNGWIE